MKGRHGPYKSAAEAHLILENYDESRKKLMELYDKCSEIFEQLKEYPDYQNEAQSIYKNMNDILGNIISIDKDEIESINKNKGKQAAIDAGAVIKNKYSQSKDSRIKSLEEYIDRIVNSLNGNKDTTTNNQ